MAERFEIVEKALLAMLEEKKYATLRDILVTMNPIDIAGIFDGLEERLHRQKKNAAKWDATLRDYGPYRSLKSSNGEPNYWVYGILAPDKRACIRQFRELGYYASGVHINNNIYSVFGKQPTLKGVDQFMNSFVALPCGWWMADQNEA